MLRGIVAVGIMFPIIPFLLLFMGLALTMKNGKRALHWSADIVTWIFPLSMYSLLYVMIPGYATLVIGSLYLFIAAVVVVHEYVRGGEFMFVPLFRRMWRIYFASGLLLYMLIGFTTFIMFAIDYMK